MGCVGWLLLRGGRLAWAGGNPASAPRSGSRSPANRQPRCPAPAAPLQPKRGFFGLGGGPRVEDQDPVELLNSLKMRGEK